MSVDTPVRFQLSGRRALVTGAASGIGLATAERLARSGAQVALNDISTTKLAEQVERLQSEGLTVVAVPGDLSRSETALAVARAAAEQLGGMDYLINNAGAPLTRTPIPAADLDALSDEFYGDPAHQLAQRLLDGPAAPRRICEHRAARSSTRCPSPRWEAGEQRGLRHAKAGLVAWTRELARGLAPAVRVNGIAPSFVNSPGMLVRRHRGGGPGDGAAGASRRARGLCRGHRLSLCRRCVHHRRSDTGHGRRAYLGIPDALRGAIAAGVLGTIVMLVGPSVLIYTLIVDVPAHPRAALERVLELD